MLSILCNLTKSRYIISIITNIAILLSIIILSSCSNNVEKDRYEKLLNEYNSLQGYYEEKISKLNDEISTINNSLNDKNVNIDKLNSNNDEFVSKIKIYRSIIEKINNKDFDSARLEALNIDFGQITEQDKRVIELSSAIEKYNKLKIVAKELNNRSEIIDNDFEKKILSYFGRCVVIGMFVLFFAIVARTLFHVIRNTKNSDEKIKAIILSSVMIFTYVGSFSVTGIPVNITIFSFVVGLSPEEIAIIIGSGTGSLFYINIIVSIIAGFAAGKFCNKSLNTKGEVRHDIIQSVVLSLILVYIMNSAMVYKTIAQGFGLYFTNTAFVFSAAVSYALSPSLRGNDMDKNTADSPELQDDVSDEDI